MAEPLDVVCKAEPWPLDMVCGGAAAGGAICSMCRGAWTLDIVPRSGAAATLCHIDLDVVSSPLKFVAEPPDMVGR